MEKVCIMFADGFEEIEALAPLDLLRRGKVEVRTVSVMGKKEIQGSHQIRVMADELIENVDFDEVTMIVLPGGVQGTKHLSECDLLKEKLVEFVDNNKRVAAICAAPSILGELGILKGKEAICYPGYEEHLLGAEISGQSVVTDGKVTTAKGMGVSIEFGLELLKVLAGEETKNKVRSTIMYDK